MHLLLRNLIALLRGIKRSPDIVTGGLCGALRRDRSGLPSVHRPRVPQGDPGIPRKDTIERTMGTLRTSQLLSVALEPLNAPPPGMSSDVLPEPGSSSFHVFLKQVFSLPFAFCHFNCTHSRFFRNTLVAHPAFSLWTLVYPLCGLFPRLVNGNYMRGGLVRKGMMFKMCRWC